MQTHKPAMTSGLGSSNSRVVSVSMPSQAGMQEPAHRSMTMMGKSLEPDETWLGELGGSSLQNRCATGMRAVPSCPISMKVVMEKMKWPASVWFQHTKKVAMV